MEHIFYYREKTDVKYPTLYIRACAYVYARKGKRDYSNGNFRDFPAHIQSSKKRKGI